MASLLLGAFQEYLNDLALQLRQARAGERMSWARRVRQEKRLGWRDSRLAGKLGITARRRAYVPPDTGWKQRDYEELARYRRIRAADAAFDAEVEDLSPEEWYRLQQRAVALQIEQVQKQAQEICVRHGNASPECQQAWQRTNQEVAGITRAAGLQPQRPYSKVPASLPPIRFRVRLRADFIPKNSGCNFTKPRPAGMTVTPLL